MKKLNQNGFLLAETLITSCVIAILATSLYVYVSKIINNYEKRDNYDNIVDIYKLNNLVSYCKESELNCRRKNVSQNNCLPFWENGGGYGIPVNISNVTKVEKYAYICKGNGFKENLLNRMNSENNDPEYKEYVRLLSLSGVEENDFVLITKLENSQGRKKSFASLKMKVGF